MITTSHHTGGIRLFGLSWSPLDNLKITPLRRGIIFAARIFYITIPGSLNVTDPRHSPFDFFPNRYLDLYRFKCSGIFV